MVIGSELAFWIIAAVFFLVAVAAALIGSFVAFAGYIVLRDRGYGTISSALSVLVMMFAVPGVVFTTLFGVLPDGPSPRTDLTPVVLVLAGGVLVAGAGAGCWAVARRMPRRKRRDGGPRRRLRYRMWGILVGCATIPAGIFLWRTDDWMMAIRAPTLTIPIMYLLFSYESRAKNKIEDDTDLGTFVLSLRGFADDLKLTITADPEETRWAQTGLRNRVNLEQFIADEMETRVGRMIAFGSPRDKLPGGGAGRIYAPEDGWRDKVEGLAKESRAIVMQIGESRSLADELEIIKRCGLAPKLFVLTQPPGRKVAWSLRFNRLFGRLTGWPDPTWSGFADLLRRHDFDPGPDDPGPGAVVTFDAARRRVDVRRACRTPSDYVTAIADRLAVTGSRA